MMTADDLQTRLHTHRLTFDSIDILRTPPTVTGFDWWHERGNRLYLSPGVELPKFDLFPGLAPPQNAIVVIGSGCVPGRFFLWGEAPIVCLGHAVVFPDADIACGGGSIIVVNDNVSSAEGAQLNARNGGFISVGKNGLWSSYVTLYTDDMHAICDAATGRRLNPRGGKIIVEEHVWLGYEAMIMRSARIGSNTIVGARSMVTSDLPPNSVCAGVPARAIRSGVTWDHNDLPLEDHIASPRPPSSSAPGKTLRQRLGFGKPPLKDMP